MASSIGYVPQPLQRKLHTCAANEVLFGGAAGPGKSTALRHEALIWCLRVPRLQVYFFRRTFPEIEKNHIIPALSEFPRDIGEYGKGDKRWTFRNNSMLHWCHCQYEQDVFSYQGAEIHLLVIDELTTFSEFIYRYLRSRVRCTVPVPAKWAHKIPGIISASNPGGVGHEFAKRYWVDFCGKSGGIKRAAEADGGMLRAYIPGKLDDNPLLMAANPGYRAQLDALPEPYRTAYKDGDWDIFAGQAFAFHDRYHVVDDFPIPDVSPLYMTFDWGYGAPFSAGWWWEDNDHRLYRFAEWYGWTGTPGQGLRLTDTEIAEGICEREERMGIRGKPVTRLSGPDCFSKKPNYLGGGQGPSTAEVFATYRLILRPGDPDRSIKFRRLRDRLRVKLDEHGALSERPMLQVYRSCEQFVRAMRIVSVDPHNPEELAPDQEDHVIDEACHICMLRASHSAAIPSGSSALQDCVV